MRSAFFLLCALLLALLVAGSPSPATQANTLPKKFSVLTEDDVIESGGSDSLDAEDGGELDEEDEVDEEESSGSDSDDDGSDSDDDGSDSDDDEDDDHEEDYADYSYESRSREEESADEESDDQDDHDEKSADRVQSREQDVRIRDDLIEVSSVAKIADDLLPEDSFRIRIDRDDGLELRVDTTVDGIESDFRAEFVSIVEYYSDVTASYLFGSSVVASSVEFEDLTFGPFVAQDDVVIDEVTIKSWSTTSTDGLVTITGRMPDASVTVDGLLLSANRMKIDVIIEGYAFTTGGSPTSLAVVAKIRYTTGDVYVTTRLTSLEPVEIYSGAGVFNWRSTATAYDISDVGTDFHVTASPTFPVDAADAAADVEVDETERFMSFSFLDQSNPAKIVWDPEVGVSYSAPAVQKLQSSAAQLAVGVVAALALVF